jgi:uncharacterized membrane protein YtjA (UPF0391 family)
LTGFPRQLEQSQAAHIIGSKANLEGGAMLNLVVTLLIIGLIAAVLGFGGIAGASFGLAKIIFFIVLVLFLLSVVFGTLRRPLL